jgi:cytochrome oxidase Cu insertion factor (SCO1/SenC/PrrC family)
VITLVTAVTLTAATASATPDWAAVNMQPYETPKPAPAFTLPDLDGRPQTLESVRGKVLLLFFWTTW